MGAMDPTDEQQRAMEEALKRAIDLAGGQAALAKRMKPPVKPQAVQQWKRVPDGQVLNVAQALDFGVTPHELRSDLYPYPDDALPLPMRGGRGISASAPSP